MTNISPNDILNCILLGIYMYCFKFYWMYSPIDNTPAAVREMACGRVGTKPTPGPVMTHFDDAYVRQ